MEPVLVGEVVRAVGDVATLSDWFDTARALVTGAIQWTGSIVSTVTSNPIILAFFLLGLVGLGIGLLNRLKSL